MRRRRPRAAARQCAHQTYKPDSLPRTRVAETATMRARAADSASAQARRDTRSSFTAHGAYSRACRRAAPLSALQNAQTARARAGCARGLPFPCARRAATSSARRKAYKLAPSLCAALSARVDARTPRSALRPPPPAPPAATMASGFRPRAGQASSCARDEESVPLAPGDYSGHLPVDIANMPVVPCPLIKLGNRVIICGRYADHHTCVKAANNLGVLMLSDTFSQTLPPNTLCSEERFLADWRAFHFEIYGLVPKLPTVSGSKLDLFLFAQQILLLGGIDTVIEKRGFVVLAKQLRLSKPCTSAATVLRRAHQSLMHQYESKLMQLSAAQSSAPQAIMAHAASPCGAASTLASHPMSQRLHTHDAHQSSPRKKMRRLSEPQAFTTALQSAHSLQYEARLSTIEPTLRSHFSRDEAVVLPAAPRLPPVTSLTSAMCNFSSSNRSGAPSPKACKRTHDANYGPYG
ncbi:hypothetical protein FGB62_94g046 [Gracilaria domingensis]|nr:hypothetical protein FGB62_94g046 [Gracilaria domingensis]